MKKNAAKRTRTSATQRLRVTVRENQDLDVTPIAHRVSPREIHIGSDKTTMHLYLCEERKKGLVMFGGHFGGPGSDSLDMDGTIMTIGAVEAFAAAVTLAVQTFRKLPARETGPERQVG